MNAGIGSTDFPLIQAKYALLQFIFTKFMQHGLPAILLALKALPPPCICPLAIALVDSRLYLLKELVILLAFSTGAAYVFDVYKVAMAIQLAILTVLWSARCHGSLIFGVDRLQGWVSSRVQLSSSLPSQGDQSYSDWTSGVPSIPVLAQLEAPRRSPVQLLCMPVEEHCWRNLQACCIVMLIAAWARVLVHHATHLLGQAALLARVCTLVHLRAAALSCSLHQTQGAWEHDLSSAAACPGLPTLASQLHSRRAAATAAADARTAPDLLLPLSSLLSQAGTECNSIPYRSAGSATRHQQDGQPAAEPPTPSFLLQDGEDNTSAYPQSALGLAAAAAGSVQDSRAHADVRSLKQSSVEQLLIRLPELADGAAAVGRVSLHSQLPRLIRAVDDMQWQWFTGQLGAAPSATLRLLPKLQGSSIATLEQRRGWLLQAGFSPTQILYMVTAAPELLSASTDALQRRLDVVVHTFALSADSARQTLAALPSLWTCDLEGRAAQLKVLYLKQEMGFSLSDLPPLMSHSLTKVATRHSSLCALPGSVPLTPDDFRKALEYGSGAAVSHIGPQVFRRYVKHCWQQIKRGGGKILTAQDALRPLEAGLGDAALKTEWRAVLEASPPLRASQTTHAHCKLYAALYAILARAYALSEGGARWLAEEAAAKAADCAAGQVTHPTESAAMPTAAVAASDGGVKEKAVARVVWSASQHQLMDDYLASIAA